MNQEKVEEIMSKHLSQRVFKKDKPQVEDWDILEKKLGYSFPKEYKYFFELLSEYIYEGEVFDVSENELTTGDSYLLSVYEYEVENYNWNTEFIPIISIGNGDYICFNKVDDSVQYYYHDSINSPFEKINSNFEEWLLSLNKWI